MAAEMSENYAGRVLQRSAFRSLVGRKRTPGSAMSSVLAGIPKLPPQPGTPAAPHVPAAQVPAATAAVEATDEPIGPLTSSTDPRRNRQY